MTKQQIVLINRNKRERKKSERSCCLENFIQLGILLFPNLFTDSDTIT